MKQLLLDMQHYLANSVMVPNNETNKQITDSMWCRVTEKLNDIYKEEKRAKDIKELLLKHVASIKELFPGTFIFMQEYNTDGYDYWAQVSNPQLFSISTFLTLLGNMYEEEHNAGVNVCWGSCDELTEDDIRI